MIAKDYNTMVICGGGAKGISLLGAIQYILHQNPTITIQKYIGTSIGAIMSILMAIGYEPYELILKMVQNQYLNQFEGYSMVHGLQGNGFLDFEPMSKVLEELILAKVEQVPTLQELVEKFGKQIVAVTFNYSKNREEILCAENFPNLSVLMVMRMTSNVPFIFDHFQYEGDYYIDGFMTNAFPINLIEYPTDRAIGINIVQDYYQDVDGKSSMENIHLFSNLFVIPFYQIQSLRNKSYEEKCDVISINLSETSMFEFQMSNKKLLDMYSIGYSECRTEYEKLKNKKDSMTEENHDETDIQET